MYQYQVVKTIALANELSKDGWYIAAVQPDGLYLMAKQVEPSVEETSGEEEITE